MLIEHSTLLSYLLSCHRSHNVKRKFCENAQDCLRFVDRRCYHTERKPPPPGSKRRPIYELRPQPNQKIPAALRTLRIVPMDGVTDLESAFRAGRSQQPRATTGSAASRGVPS